MRAIPFGQFRKEAPSPEQLAKVTEFLTQAGWVQLDNVWVSGMESLTVLGALNLQKCVALECKASIELEITVYDGQLALRVVK